LRRDAAEVLELKPMAVFENVLFTMLVEKQTKKSTKQ